MKRIRNFNGALIPSAARWELHSCGSCPNAHVILFDDEDVPFAEMILDRETLSALHVKGNQLMTDAVNDNIKRQQ